MMNTNEQQPAGKQTESKRPVETVRSGAIGASIWQETSEAGKPYIAFTLSRSWKAREGDGSGYSHKYFAQNRAELHAVIDLACDAAETIGQAQADVANQAANA